MKIINLLKKQFTVSFEFFPPKTEEGEEDLFLNLKRLEELHPSFVSVTYGAGGSSRDRTRRVVARIANEEKLNVMAHLTSIGHTKNEIMDILDSYKNLKIENIMALRGDLPSESQIDPYGGDLQHASDLMELIRRSFGSYFSIGGAVYTRRHPESKDWECEMTHILKKQHAGMEFGITQIFFDNREFYNFMDRSIKYGISIPIIPGIMPVTLFSQIENFSVKYNAPIPAGTVSEMERFKDKPEEVEKIGIDFTVEQCQDLLANNIKGLHFYTLNKSQATLKIYRTLLNLPDKQI
jgi:methylenetetrahydrofolate reductase (NADPH)